MTGYKVEWGPRGSSGTEFLGPVDRIPDLGCFVTRFRVLYLLPIVPAGSFFVFDGTERVSEFSNIEVYGERTTVRAIPMKLSLRSLLLGYVQGILRITSYLSAFCIAAGLYGIWQEGNVSAYSFAGISIAAFGLTTGLFHLCNHISKASPERTEALLQVLRAGGDK